MGVKLTYNQRHFVFEQFHKAFSSHKIVDGKRIVDVYGATTQVLLREALHTFCFTYPLNPELKKKSNGVNSEKKQTFRDVYLFTIVIPLPRTVSTKINGRDDYGGEIILEQEIDKIVLEKH
jgi:hypothetical protein